MLDKLIEIAHFLIPVGIIYFSIVAWEKNRSKKP